MSTADIIIVADKSHIVESYSTNFLTGETKFNLIQVDNSTVDLFTTKNVSIGDSSSSSSCYMDATTGLATQIFTDNTTSQSSIGGASGVYRVAYDKDVTEI